MDARQLRFFLAVIDYEGFSKAAEQLYIAQPSLSQAIAGLERELGVALFHRVGRGVKPTDAGLNLIGPARQVLRDLASAQSAMDAVKGITTGRVEIITMPSPGVEPLTTIMQQFVNDHPDITLSVDAAFIPEEVLHAVRTGACEIGLLGADQRCHEQLICTCCRSRTSRSCWSRPLVVPSPAGTASGRKTWRVTGWWPLSGGR